MTGGIDAPAAWLNAHIQMIRQGMAFVGVDAQAGGIYGQAGSIAAKDGAGGIKQTDPARYGSLHHPGDSFSYSIYEQAGQALHADGSQLLGGLVPQRVIALGESQSAFRLVTYINAVQPLSPGIYDAYFVYSRGGDGADLSQSPQKTIPTPTPTYIRTDLHVPVFLFETESDLLGLGYLAARQPATPYIREWETAGTAHDDTYGLLYSRSDTGNGAADTSAFSSMLSPPKDPIPGIVDCAAPINAGSHTYELRAAVQAVNTWVTTGHAPPQSPRLEVNPTNPHAFLHDANGNALGRDPVAAGRRTRRQALGCGPARGGAGAHPCGSQHERRLGSGPVRDLRHHRAVQRGQAGGALPDARRLREEVGRGDGSRGQAGLPAAGRRSDPRQRRRTVQRGRLRCRHQPSEGSPDRRPFPAARSGPVRHMPLYRPRTVTDPGRVELNSTE